MFRHPLIRAAVYRNAPHHLRITVHGGFAQVLTAAADADRRAWHLAAATTEPDESVARALEETARRQQRRGGAMAVSAAYDRAGRLSVDPERKAHRILLAARAAYDAGKPDRATRLAAEAESLTDALEILADATHIRAQAADRELLLRGTAMLDSLRLPRNSPLIPHVAAQISWAAMLMGEPERSVPAMTAQIAAARDDSVDDLHKVVAAFSGLMLADDAAAATIMDEMVTAARAIGELQWIPYALELSALAHLFDGSFNEARADVAEGISISEELGMPIEVAALGRPAHTEIENRVIVPLDLHHTRWLGDSPTIPHPHARAYQFFGPGSEVDVTEQRALEPENLSWITTTQDLNTFFRALLGGRLLPADRLAQMRQTVPVRGDLETMWPGGRYGLGLAERPLTCGGTYWSHEGGDGGYITLNGVTSDGTRSAVVSMSEALGDSPEHILTQESAAATLIDHALCP
ncbi:serine hydrolase [Nocardia sp. NPDC127579]|uniref:serine hydrolase n=1 Tax=Nocardia sp. NPDC127579 TaxID=3345402 RepID=UPI00362FB51F